MASSEGQTERTVFVTGAAGFIGGYVVEEFIAHGWHVYALVHRRESERLGELSRAGKLTLVHGDASDPDLARHALVPALGEGQLEAVVHCAGRASDVGRWSEFQKANLESVCNLVTLTRELKRPRLVFISTTDVYGLRDFQGETEDNLPLCNNTGNPYPESKIRAEDYIRQNLSPERWTIIRPAAVWGVGDRTLTPRLVGFLQSSPCLVHFGHWRGRNRWPLAHVRNVAAAIYAATIRPEAGGWAINVLDDEHTTTDEFLRLLSDIYLPGKRLRAITLPVWAVWPWAAVITVVANALNLSHPPSDPSLYALRTASTHLDFDNHRLHQVLAAAGLCMVTREEGLRELAREVTSTTEASST